MITTEVPRREQDYNVRRLNLCDAFDQLPRGARMVASQDLGVAPTIISNTINGHVRREDIITKLENWIDDTTVEDIASRRDRTTSRIAGIWAFISTYTENDPQHMTNAQDLYDAYVMRASDLGHAPLAYGRFVTVLRSRYPLTRVHDDAVFAGIKVIDPND